MAWLLAFLAWTVCTVVVAPVIGRVLAHGGRAPSRRAPSARRMYGGLPAPRSPLPLS